MTFCSIFADFGMSWMPIPIFFVETKPISMVQAQKWCDRNVPSTDIKTFDELVPALSYALGTTEHHLRDMVEPEYLDENSFSHVTTSH